MKTKKRIMIRVCMWCNSPPVAENTPSKPKGYIPAPSEEPSTRNRVINHITQFMISLLFLDHFHNIKDPKEV